jgi:hypothetical protein
MGAHGKRDAPGQGIIHAGPEDADADVGVDMKGTRGTQPVVPDEIVLDVLQDAVFGSAPTVFGATMTGGMYFRPKFVA